MALPRITLNLDNTIYGFPAKGNLVYQYNPFQNLQNPKPTGSNPDALLGLRMNSQNAGINITEPLKIETAVSYDDSVNLIITDNVNTPKIVNSRFYQTSSSTYEIADRKGNLDTNIYLEENFQVEAGLIKSVRTITTVDFLGIKDGGNMPVGNYTFYFRLADADGNESDFIAESGKVVCHIGAVNSPKAIRGGQLLENSYKIIKFKLNNLDLAYDYINIYYTKSTGDGDQEITQTFKITDKFKITNNDVIISITGYENHEEISIDDINIQYAAFDAVKSLTTCQNIMFAGNTVNDYNLFKTLEKYSLFITPEAVYDDKGIGNLTYNYDETYLDNGFEYYNAKNIYYKLGYWDEEIYRFGIVYILNNYTLSPVFNVRGRKLVDLYTSDSSKAFTNYLLTDTLNYGEDYLLENPNDSNNPENVKGVFKIDCSVTSMFDNEAADVPIKPIGIKFNFINNVVDGIPAEFIPGLQDLTKGFFIVRQKRIPTILTQAVGIATSSKANIPVIQGYKTSIVPAEDLAFNYFSESFLTMNGLNPKLAPSFFKINNTDVINNALLCPEASLRRTTFNTFFNSSEYLLKDFKYATANGTFTSRDGSKNFSLKGLFPSNVNSTKTAELTLIEPGIELIRNSKYDFCSKAGDAIMAYQHVDPVLGDYTDPESTVNTWNTTASKVRGEFNTFLGANVNNLIHGRYYNIFQKDYDYSNWKDYFILRYNDSSPFLPISDRMTWDNMGFGIDTGYGTVRTSDKLFRGDCYINTVTQRMHWNFIDSEMPTNKRIVDPYTWAKNFRVIKKASTIVDGTDSTIAKVTLNYNKLLLLFTYKDVFEPEWSGDTRTFDTGDTVFVSGLIEPDAKKFKKYSERNGLFGAEKINKPDVNAVPLGHWVTFKICSNINLAMRDLDFSRPMEEAVHRVKRGFYPLQSMDTDNHLPESDVINNGISKSLGDKYYFELPDVPFIRTNFATRIYYSNILQNSAFTNGNRVFEARNYLDYTREYGSLVQLVEWYGSLIAIMEHGILMIPVNERAMMKNETGENIYINTATVLPQNPKVISNTFGSLWPESITKTSRFIYGIDTVGKKIWRTNGETYESISDMKIQKFLNDNINLKESDKDRTVNVNFIKAHYNAFKQDIMFTFRYNGKLWNLCWNELTEKWVTQYTWFPEFSENINNIFYTFANQTKHILAENKLYKHGFAGMIEEAGNIKPTFWYDEQHPFEYEFVVADIPGVQKIYDNLRIISNLAEPDSFYYEVVGEGFDWHSQKDLIKLLNDSATDLLTLQASYKTYLLANPTVKKIPFIWIRDLNTNWPIANSNRDLSIEQHNKTKENLVSSYQKGLNIRTNGRMKGNMQYLEDSWDTQIQPITFKYAYILNGELVFTTNTEMKIRDKYIKVRVKYKGDQYAIINALRTLFTISYA